MHAILFGASCLVNTLLLRGYTATKLKNRFPDTITHLNRRQYALAIKNVQKGVVLLTCIPIVVFALDEKYRGGVDDSDNPWIGLVAGAYVSQDAAALITIPEFLHPRTRYHHVIVCALWLVLVSGYMTGPFEGAIWLCSGATPTGVVNIYLGLRHLSTPREVRSMASMCFWFYLAVFCSTVIHQLLLLSEYGMNLASWIWLITLSVVWYDDFFLLEHLQRARTATHIDHPYRF